MLLHSLDSIVAAICTVLGLMQLNIVWKEGKKKPQPDPVADKAKTAVKGGHWQRLIFRCLWCDIVGKAQYAAKYVV